MTDEAVQKFLGDAEKWPGTGATVWPPTQLKTEAYLCSADDHQGVFNLFFFFFYRMTNTSTITAHPANKVGMQEEAHPFYLRSSSFQTVSIHQSEFRCSADIPMAPFFTLQRDLAQAVPDAPRGSSRHRQIVAVYPSSSKLSGWSVSTHPASDYTSLFCQVWLLSPFFPSLDPCEFAPWRKNKKLKTKKSFHLGRTCLLIPACCSFLSVPSVKGNHPHLD